EVAKLELELKQIGNSIGMGAMGFVGSSMVIDCHVEVGYTHTGGMPMSVHSFCLSSRRATARIHDDGTIVYRTDPRWFTPYLRRNSIAWDTTAKTSRQSD
ncbi:MAG: fumarate hydratase, partial [Gammaproteobacteria bacterium]